MRDMPCHKRQVQAVDLRWELNAVPQLKIETVNRFF